MLATNKKLSLPSYLFWDIDLERMDFDYSYQLVIERVIKMGTLPIWRTTQSYFGADKFIEVADKSRQLTDHERAFTHLFIKSSYNAASQRRSNLTEDPGVAASIE